MKYLDKIKDVLNIKKIISQLRAKGNKVVFTNGCFDIIHLGHIRYLHRAKELGDILVVAINSDSSVRKIKGSKRPILDERTRAEILASIECVDFVLIFNENTPKNVIHMLMPHIDILVKGGDWREDQIIGSEIVIRAGGRVATVPYISGFSTTSIIDKIIKRFCI